MADYQEGFLNTKEEDFSKYFLEQDSLRTFDWELSLTLNKRYKCMAGCQMCYLGEQWISHNDFVPIAKYTEKNLTPEWEYQFFEFAENFKVLSTIDDMRYLKKNFPIQYDFYKRNSEQFLLSSMTDQALFYHYDILMDEMKFKDIYEISFSDKFVSRNRKKLVGMFKNILKRYSLRHVKVVTGNNGATDKDIKEVKEFFKFLRGEGIDTLHHHNVMKDWVQVDDAAHAIYSEGDGPFSLLNQVTFIAFDDIYTELKNFTAKDNKFRIACLYEVGDFSEALPRLLKTKLDTYKENAEILQDKNSHYVKYFKHCADTFKVNQDYTFIPYVLIRDDANWYNKMLDSGDWKHVGPGLLRVGADDVISIIETRKDGKV